MIRIESRKCSSRPSDWPTSSSVIPSQRPDERRQQRQQQALGVREHLERARDRAHLLVERLEVPAAAQREVAREREAAEHEPAGGDRGGPLARPGRAATPTHVSTANSAASTAASSMRSAMIEPRIVRRLRGRARAEDRDPQHLAAARGQHVVAHVADEREPVGVGALVRDLGQAHDPVPAPAAGGQRERVDPERAHQPEVAAERCRGTSARPGWTPTTRRRRARSPRRRSRARRWSCGLGLGISGGRGGGSGGGAPAPRARPPARGREAHRALGRDRAGAAVVAAAEVVLEEHVEHDEQVAAAHLVELQLRRRRPRGCVQEVGTIA